MLLNKNTCDALRLAATHAADPYHNLLKYPLFSANWRELSSRGLINIEVRETIDRYIAFISCQLTPKGYDYLDN